MQFLVNMFLFGNILNGDEKSGNFTFCNHNRTDSDFSDIPFICKNNPFTSAENFLTFLSVVVCKFRQLHHIYEQIINIGTNALLRRHTDM